MIPRKLHRIWFGDKPIPQRYEEYWQEWQELHPDWQFFTWTEENRPVPINARVWDEVPTYARSCGVSMAKSRAIWVQWADVLGYELLYQYGGVYVNCDVKPLRSFEPLLGFRAFVGMEDSYHICNAVMGGTVGNPFYQAVIQAIGARWNQLKHSGMEISTGPQLLTSIWRENVWDLEVLEQKAFYPIHHGQVAIGSGDIDEVTENRVRAGGSFTLHAWGHRWQEGAMDNG